MVQSDPYMLQDKAALASYLITNYKAYSSNVFFPPKILSPSLKIAHT